MKLGNMDCHQSKMFFLMDEVMSEIISDYRYYMAVYAPYTPQHKTAKVFFLKEHDELASYFYNEVMSRCKTDSYYRDALFAGGDFLKESINKRLKLYGY